MSASSKGNGSLDDEHGLVPKPVKLRWWDRDGAKPHRFGPIRISSGDDDNQAMTSFYAISQRPDQTRSLLLYPADYRYGKLRLGKNVYAVAVVDGDYDGRFDSRVSLPVDNPAVRLPRGNLGRWARADIFAIDYDRDGQFEMYPSIDLEVMPLGKLMRLGSRYYAITVARDGSRLALEAVEPAMGRLIFDPPHATMDLRLWSDATYQSFHSANNLDLPAGNYQATSAALILQDTDRNEWKYEMVLGKLGPLGFFAIDANQTTRIRMGPPFRVTTDIEESQTNALTIRPIIQGTAGERYYWVCKNTRDSNVTFRIVTENGTVLVDDEFEYGGGGGFWYRWRVPSYFKGKYQVQINVDLGPFEVTHDRKWRAIE
jgi:hypothetical protein